jgi:exodeoxyribonuclease VII large subunit
MPIYTVSQITEYLKETLEHDPMLAELWISGEISNLRTAASGHNYFTLKDSQSQLRSVMFKGGRGADLLHEGSLVTAHGRISFYETRGDVQIIADLVMPEGTGPLFLELEKLKMRLEEEGLFQPSRKRPLPRFPRVIGVVTSPSGAVLHDICNVITRRYRLVEILLAPTQVQGDEAAPQIVSAIQALNQEERSDVIILARGGGSLEELWPFNEEMVARAIYASRIPVVSAVGHERDYTISDFVADVRAPTPSAAAELVVPDGAVLMQDVSGYSEKMVRAMSYQLSTRRREVDGMARYVKGHAPDVATMRRRVDDLARAASTALANRHSLWQERVKGHQHRLQALNPNAILVRGYAIVQKQPAGALDINGDNGHVVYRKEQVKSGEELNVTVSDGSFAVTVGDTPKKTRSTRTRKAQANAGARLF